MIDIVFSVYSFLQRKLNLPPEECHGIKRAVPKGSRVSDLIEAVGLEPEDVEAAFVNGKVRRTSVRLHDGDRVALIPHGTPGPYRLTLGIRNSK